MARLSPSIQSDGRTFLKQRLQFDLIMNSCYVMQKRHGRNFQFIQLPDFPMLSTSTISRTRGRAIDAREYSIGSSIYSIKKEGTGAVSVDDATRDEYVPSMGNIWSRHQTDWREESIDYSLHDKEMLAQCRANSPTEYLRRKQYSQKKILKKI